MASFIPDAWKPSGRLTYAVAEIERMSVLIWISVAYLATSAVCLLALLLLFACEDDGAC